MTTALELAPEDAKLVFHGSRRDLAAPLEETVPAESPADEGIVDPPRGIGVGASKAIRGTTPKQAVDVLASAHHISGRFRANVHLFHFEFALVTGQFEGWHAPIPRSFGVGSRTTVVVPAGIISRTQTPPNSEIWHTPCIAHKPFKGDKKQSHLSSSEIDEPSLWQPVVAV